MSQVEPTLPWLEHEVLGGLGNILAPAPVGAGRASEGRSDQLAVVADDDLTVVLAPGDDDESVVPDPLDGAGIDVVGAAPSITSACEGACELLHRRGELRAIVYLLRNDLLRCRAQRGHTHVLDGFTPGVGLAGQAVRTGRLAVAGAPAVVALDERPPVAELAVPLRRGDDVVGALVVGAPRDGAAGGGRHLDPADERAALVVASRLEQRLAEDDGSDADTALARLARSSMSLAGVADEDELRRRVVRAACDVARTSSGMVAQRRADGSFLVGARTGPLGAALGSLTPVDIELLASSVALASSCSATVGAGARNPAGADRLVAAGARFVAITPLLARGRRTGILVVADHEARPVSTDDLEALELLGAEAAQALALAGTFTELRDRASTDPLTGLGNHAAFYDALRGRRYGDTALLALDLDGFKPVNDTYGHLTGDRLLRDLARALPAALRPGDRLFRVGGDEFAAVLPVGGYVAAVALARQLRLAALPVLAPFGAGVSIGAAVAMAGETSAAFVGRADDALYRAKRSRADLEVA